MFTRVALCQKSGTKNVCSQIGLCILIGFCLNLNQTEWRAEDRTGTA